jgi:O-antigen ligase
MRGPIARARTATPTFWFLTIFLVLVFLTGGTSRSDAPSILVLQPFSVLACGVALATLRREHLSGRAWLVAGFALCFTLILLHLIPLPSGLWQSMRGRDDMLAVDRAAGLDGIWRPLSFTPLIGWQSFASLFAPLAVFLFGVQLNRSDLYRLLPVLIGLGAASGLLGLLQIISGAAGSLHLYSITNVDSAVGLFANRNHAATLLACLFPMLAVFASTAGGNDDSLKGRQLVSIAIAIVLIPLILVTGSRAGLLLSVVALAAAALLYWQSANKPSQGKETKRRWLGMPLLTATVVLCLGLLTVYYSRAEAVDRLFGQALDADSRSAFWAQSLTLFQKYFPLGSGAGTFVAAYQLIEQNHVLSPYYLNRAHNDWIEVAVTFGIPGIIFMTSVVILFVRRTKSLWSRSREKRGSTTFGRMAGIAIMIISVASIADYPLRIPAMSCVFVILMLWFAKAANMNAKVIDS